MKNIFLFTGIGLVSLFLILGSFTMNKHKHSSHKAVVAVIIYNHSSTKTITYAKVGPYTYTSLSIPPGGSVTNYELDFSGSYTFSVGCSTAYIGAMAYCETADYNTVCCNNTQTGALHTLTCTANFSSKHIVEIFESNMQCL